MSGLPLSLPALYDRRNWPLWATRLQRHCRLVYRDQSALISLAVQYPNVEDELPHLMSNDNPFPLYDGMERSLSRHVKDCLMAYAGTDYPTRSHPKELYALIKTFFCPSPSQMDMHISKLATRPISDFESIKQFTSFAKLVKIAANRDSTMENQRLTELLETAIEVEDPAQLPTEDFVNCIAQWNRLIAILEE